jgi:cysteine-rich repeat protein
LTIVTCIEICGDGRKFYDECDDGNTVSGDGCSSICRLESGWTCVGGSTTSKSNCYNILPTASKIITNGHVVLQGQVLQGMSMSYLPANLTANGCARCNSILNVSVISTPVIPIVTVNYITATQFKFVIKFDFNNIVGSFVFNFTVRINSAFASFFTQADMDQVQVVKIDMALLSAVDARDSLTFNNLQTNDVAVQSANNNKTSIVIPGVPQEAVLILFGPDN